MSGAARDGSAVELRRRGLLEKSLTTRFGLRLHMSLMLAAAFAVGFGSNFLMLRGGFTMLTLRWIAAYLIGYAVLFVAMRCWLAYVGVRPFGHEGLGLDGDGPSASGGGSSGGLAGHGGGDGGSFGGGGGRFGGGGASMNFSEAGGGDARLLAGASASSSPSPVAAGSGPRSSGLSLSGGDLLDGDGIKLLVLVAVVLALLFAFGGGVVFMVASAPHLLADVAFGAAITSGVAPAARRAAMVPAWQGSVWRATWKPVTAMLAVLIVCGLAFSHWFPGTSTLGEAWTLLRAPRT